MRKKGFVLSCVLCACLIFGAGCGKKEVSETSEKISYGTEIYDQAKIDRILKDAKQSKKFSADEAKQYQNYCIKNVKAVMSESDDNTGRILESIKIEYGELLEVEPGNYGASAAFSQFAIDCTYLGLYLEDDSVGKKAGEIGLRYVSQVLQAKDEYQKTLKEFKTFFSKNIEKLYDECYYAGNYVIGKSRMKEGEYVLFTDHTEEGSDYTLYSSANRDSILFQGKFSYDVILSVEYGELLEIGDGCRAMPIEKVSEIDEEKGTMFKVGTNLPAGTYRLKVTGDGQGRYLLYSSSRPHETMKEEKTFAGTGKVTVQDGDYLILEYCHIVSKK